ncbi:hypothetical protein GV791_09315 [Nocardia cyriacigeorgica]|uniref:Uncharacterized protein n=1 Tax=Nocardia cyriacigeorgica TaxID=135487 RepID=A0A6P1CJI0_9NOCA|nr:hypothetical protein [Nocardia cyriacigeorgica]NEW32759.1 hypothetical protein [Nocardia cyriacigeorgica]
MDKKSPLTLAVGGIAMSIMQTTGRAAAIAAIAAGAMISAPAVASAHPDAIPHYHVWNDLNNTCPDGMNEWNISVLNFQIWALCTN